MKSGKRIKPERKKPVAIPALLAEALAGDALLSERFGAFTPSKQREFAEYIGEARREETKARRLEKVVSVIRTGVGNTETTP